MNLIMLHPLPHLSLNHQVANVPATGVDHNTNLVHIMLTELVVVLLAMTVITILTNVDVMNVAIGSLPTAPSMIVFLIVLVVLMRPVVIMVVGKETAMIHVAVIHSVIKLIWIVQTQPVPPV